MISKLKESFLLRSLFYHVLKNLDTSRKMSGSDKRLYFNAGTNLNLFFRKDALIEPGITNNIKVLLKKNFTIYDIGANIGYYTLFFSQLANEGKVIAFEPDPANFKYLVKNKELNNLHTVTLVNEGVSSETGISEFYQDITTGRTSSIEVATWHPNATKLKKVSINKTTLDEVSKVYGKPHLIKCDVEGHEVEVLRGATEVLSSNPILMLEVKDVNRVIIKNILLDNNYQFFNAELPIEHANNSATIIEFPNVLCVHKDFIIDD